MTSTKVFADQRDQRVYNALLAKNGDAGLNPKELDLYGLRDNDSTTEGLVPQRYQVRTSTTLDENDRPEDILELSRTD
jgi:hypothetical protein